MAAAQDVKTRQMSLKSPTLQNAERSTRTADLQRSLSRVEVTVLRAHVPRIKKQFGRRRRLFVTVTDGATMKKTISLQIDGHTVHWNQTLDAFYTQQSSQLTLRLYEKRLTRPDVVIGTHEIPIPVESRNSVPIILSDGDVEAGQSTQPVTLYLSIIVGASVAAPNLPNDPQKLPTEGDDSLAEELTEPSMVPDSRGLIRTTAPEPRFSLPYHLPVETGTPILYRRAWMSSTEMALRNTNRIDRSNTWEKAVGRIKWVMDTLAPIAELSPYANMACGLLFAIPKTLLEQFQRDDNVRTLLEAMHDAFDFAHHEDTLRSIKPESYQAQILTLMMQDVCSCCDFIQSYSKDSQFWRRALKNTGSGVAKDIEDLSVALVERRRAFLDQATITEMMVLQILDDTGIISAKVNSISTQRQWVSGQVSDAELDAKIREIPYATGSRFTPDKGCLTGTRTAFLDFIVNWVNDPTSERSLVLFGQAGTGKSTIAHEIACRFDKVHRLTSSFIFLRKEQPKPHHLFTTLARDLSDRYPSFKIALGGVIKDNSSLRIGTRDYATLFQSIILEPLKGLHIVGPILVVIDALDESGDTTGRNGLHTFLAGNLSKLPSNFRVLITSRPEDVIQSAFYGTPSTRIKYMNDPELAARTDDDIVAYFRRLLPSDEFAKYGIALARRAEGLFQWAAVAGGFILNPESFGFSRKECIDHLLKLTTDRDGQDPLDELYEEILRGYITHRTARLLFRSVVGQLITAFEPLSIRSLTTLRRHAFNDNDDADSVVIILRRLGSLLSNVNSSDETLPIVPLHPSFRDFLINKKSGDFCIVLRDTHYELAHSCLGLLLRELKFNICNLESSYLANKDVTDLTSRINIHIPPALLYACRFWNNHLEQIDFDVDLFVKLRIFFETKFLFWLEALSLTSDVGLASPAFSALQVWLASGQGRVSQTELEKFRSLVNDASAFVRYFRAAIATSAPHVYLSALPFAPTCSLVSAHYSSSFPRILRVERGRLSLWPSSELVISNVGGGVLSIALSPDGQRIVSGSDDRTIRVWNAMTGETVAGPFNGHTGSVWSVAFSPDGQRIVSSSDDQTICVWNAMTGETVAGPFIGHTHWVLSVAFSPDGQRIVSGSDDRTIRVWNATTGETVAGPFTGHYGSVLSVAFSPDGQRVISGSDDRTILVWNATTGETVAGPFTGHTDSVRSVAFSPDGQRIVSGSRDGTIRVWNATTGETVAGPCTGHTDWVLSVAFSPDGQRIVSGSSDRTIRVWSATTGETVAGPFDGHTHSIWSVAFSPDGQRIVSSSHDRTIRVWNATTGETVASLFNCHTGSVLSVAFSLDGQRVVSGSDDRTIRVWNATTGEIEAGPFTRHTDSVRSVAFSPDGQRIVSGSRDRTIRVWNATTGETEAGPFTGHTHWVLSVAFSPDGQRIVSGSSDRTIRVWSATTGETEAGPFIGHTHSIWSVAFSPDGQRIVSSSHDRTIRVWNATTGETVAGPFTGHYGSVLSVAFSPDGQCIVSGSDDRTIRVWSATTGETVAGPFTGHTDSVRSVAFSPDGQRIVSGSRDRTIRIWNAWTGETEAGPFNGHTHWVLSVAFSLDCQRIVSGSSDRTIRVWSATTGETEAGPFYGHIWSVEFSPGIVSGSNDRTILSSSNIETPANVMEGRPPTPNNADDPPTNPSKAPKPPAMSSNQPHNGNIPELQTADDFQRGEINNDSSDGLWSLYLDEVEKMDKGLIESWKGDTEGIIVFTGLFSATVAAFIVESYKKLSPDSSDTTNILLTQLSAQLFNISHGIPLASVAAQSDQPFKPTASAIRVNVFWFLSLVLSLNCALSATLMQQWARRYKELALRRGAIHNHGRMRAYILDGISSFGMARAVATMPTLLHASVFLFFAGLVEFLFPIYVTVAYVTLGCVVVFVLAYTILTVLPNIYHNCPYSTPLSGLTWRMSQFCVLAFFWAILNIGGRFLEPSSKLRSSDSRQGPEPPKPKGWREILEHQVEAYRRRSSQSLRETIESSAYEAESRVVTRGLKRTLKALHDDEEIEKFASHVPGFFDSRIVKDATSAILPLMSHRPNADNTFGHRLYHLLKSCIQEPPLDESTKKRLRICLNCLWSFAKAYNKVSEQLPPIFPGTLASPEIIRIIQTEKNDPYARVIGHCFVALVVNKLAADLDSEQRTTSINNRELACLSAILGSDGRDLCNQPSAVALANMISLTFGEVGNLVGNTVPSDVLDVVQQTLTVFSRGLPENAEDRTNVIINGSDGKFERMLVSRLIDLLKTSIPVTPRLTEEERTSCLRMCLKGLWYFVHAFNQLGNSAPLPPRICNAFSEPATTHLVREESDLAARVIGRCAGALVVNKLAADLQVRSGTISVDSVEVAYLSAILGSDGRDLCNQPSAVALANMISLTFGEVGNLVGNTVPSDVLDVVQQTLAVFSRGLPENAEDRTNAIINGSDGKFERMLVSRLIDLLKTSIPVTPRLTEEERTSCLRMCLKGLWHFVHAFNQLGNSAPLPPRICNAFSEPATTHLVREESDLAARVIGRCAGALIVNKLAADLQVHSGTISVDSAEVAYLSAILGTESDGVIHLLGHLGAIEFTNIVFLALDNAGSFHPDNVPSDVLDVTEQTFSILSQALPPRLNAEMQPDQTNILTNVSGGTTYFTTGMYSSLSRIFLKNLWSFTRAYNESARNSVPLPPYVRIAFANPEMIRRIRPEGDPASRVMGSCVGALVVNKLATDITSHTSSAGDEELACLSAVLGTERHDVELLLSQPGAVAIANMISLRFGEVGSLVADGVPSDVLDVVQQTFAIFSQALPAQENAEPQLDQTIAIIHGSDGKFERMLVSRLIDLLKTSIPVTPRLTEEERTSCLRMCLKGLWYFVHAFNQLGNSAPLPPRICNTFSEPATTHLVREESDLAARVIGRCAGALIVNKLAADLQVRSGTISVDSAEVAYLSAILGTESDGVIHLLGHLGAIEFTNIVFLALDNAGSFHPDNVPSDVLDVTEQTFSILSQALPPRLNAEMMQPDQINILTNVSGGTTYLTTEMYSSFSRVFLKNLWSFTRAYNESARNSVPLPPYVRIAFANPEMIRRIRPEGDPASRVMGRCVGALVVNKLATDITSRTSSAGDEELACLSAVFGTESRDVELCLRQPGTVELVNMASLVLGDVSSLKTNMPRDVYDVFQQTLGILSQVLPVQDDIELQLDPMDAPIDISDDNFEHTVVSRLHDLLEMCLSGAQPLAEDVRKSCLRMSLKSLWHCGKARHQLDTSDPLPPYFPLKLANPDIIAHLQTDPDPVVRMIGCCFRALIASKLVVDLRSPTSLSGRVQGAELSHMLAIPGIELCEDLPLSSPHLLHVINFRNVVTFMSGETNPLFTAAGIQADVLDIAQDTLDILASRLSGSIPVPGGLPRDQQQLLQEVCSEVVSAVRSDRLKDQTVETLDQLRQILEKLPPTSQNTSMQNR
ncbi:hypothetical protein EDB86DRAFT_3074161 [Lactarius hatsudake]|nr:hypothetical protein EDB86DRAFT_3074161 [Lactarius hatsudake]